MPCQDWNAASIAISTRQQAFGLKNLSQKSIEVQETNKQKLATYVKRGKVDI